MPESDDTFIFKFHAEAKGNGHGKPKIFTKIDLDNKECLEFRSVAWENGKGGASAICTKPLKKGKGYTLKAVTGNENAESISAVLTASRAGNEN